MRFPLFLFRIMSGWDCEQWFGIRFLARILGWNEDGRFCVAALFGWVTPRMMPSLRLSFRWLDEKDRDEIIPIEPERPMRTAYRSEEPV
ncbi:hypothetical protein [Acanthopleuribacter pedis]|uniref:Uncharacterized protein n=1 Tax=Acanthopleuribacter pedis TaxID=442870 RepID=A0A8J7QCR7_9BACT|nr:hypothetical protein [Acanthopleuribacter pedis]MBO1321729.1 hypothetical protein [Acanthopleuribacter pedis]